jgi:hypothetical protein
MVHTYKSMFDRLLTQHIAALHDTPRFSYPCQFLGAKSSRSCGTDRNSC